MSRAEISERIREFIQASFRVPHGGALADDAPLLAGGIVDSMGVLELVTFAEEQFGVVFDEDDFLPANFESISALTDLVERKAGTGA